MKFPNTELKSQIKYSVLENDIEDAYSPIRQLEIVRQVRLKRINVQDKFA